MESKELSEGNFVKSVSDDVVMTFSESKMTSANAMRCFSMGLYNLKRYTFFLL